MLNFAVTATSVTDRVAHGPHDLTREPRPVLEAAAPLVGAPVELRRQERAQQVAVTEVDLDRVEARVAQHARAGAVLVGDRRDVVRGDGLRAPHPERAEHARRRERSGAWCPAGSRPGRRDRSARAIGGALGVHRVGELAQAGTDLGIVERDLVTVGAARRA